MTFDQQYREYLQLIEDGLKSYLADIREDNIVSQAMAYSLMNGGKRVRPVLALAFCDLLGGDVQNALPFACALEMVHTCSLIHDDLPCMDNDDMRRGKPSCHKQFGEEFALLAGDGLLTYAFDIIYAVGTIAPERVLACGKVLSSAAGIDGMISGQTIDLLSENTTIDMETLQKLHALKTGKMITAPCEIGVICAGGNEGDLKNARIYGQTIGLQFQIVDDILDKTGTQEQLGKPIGSDEENNKSTYVTLLGLEEAQSQANALTQKAMTVLRQYGQKAQFLMALTEKLALRNK